MSKTPKKFLTGGNECEFFFHLSDLPNYYTTFAGIVCSTMTLAFDDAIVDSIIPPLMDLFNLPQEIRDFINDQYLPEVRRKSIDE